LHSATRFPEDNTRWWQGLQPEPPAGFTVETGTRTFILTEIEIRQAWQGQGIGKRIHDELLSRRPQAAVERQARYAPQPDAKEPGDFLKEPFTRLHTSQEARGGAEHAEVSKVVEVGHASATRP
jgi:GNAT superfamily N-acetyltransferase